MGNDTNNPRGPMVIDTGGAGATGTITAATVILKQVRLVPAEAASTAALTNTAGDPVGALAAAANGNADEIDFGPDGFVTDGLKVPTLSGSGAKLYIWTK